MHLLDTVSLGVRCGLVGYPLSPLVSVPGVSHCVHPFCVLFGGSSGPTLVMTHTGRGCGLILLSFWDDSLSCTLSRTLPG